MQLRVIAFSVALLTIVVSSAGALDAAPRRSVDLSGHWILNAALSDDPEAILMKRLARDRELDERRRRQEQMMAPPGAPPLDTEAPVRRELRPWQKQHQENLLRMLGVTRTLHIEQSGSAVAITSDVDSRRFTAGARTQVSMPEGELADSIVGWDGEWFVVERKVRRGPRAVERFRLTKQGQLEYLMAWSGDTELAGIKTRRVFDRATAPAPAPDPAAGPMRFH